ncbi:MAG: hypothetical protein ABIJ56_17625 [Pseudomonadota bacterium]
MRKTISAALPAGAVILLLAGGCSLGVPEKYFPDPGQDGAGEPDMLDPVSEGDAPDTPPDLPEDPVGDSPCDAGLTLCGGECVDLNNDPDNCGACGHACEPGRLCNGRGECSVQCGEGLTQCEGAGGPYCADLTSDPGNCGTCGAICTAPAGAEPVCNNALCGWVCLPGFHDIDGQPENGCEYPCDYAGEEVCNDADDDCDKAVDEGFACRMGAAEACGPCLLGVRVCEDDCAWGPCGVSTEMCNPGENRPCTLPECGSGTQYCLPDCSWSRCEVGGVDCLPGDERACHDDECGAGVQPCSSGCSWGECVGDPPWECEPRYGNTEECMYEGVCHGVRECRDDCRWGECEEACPMFETCCSAGCVNTDWDRENCGECENACSPEERCDWGNCM